MNDLTLKYVRVTAFGIEYHDEFWWHDELASLVGERVYVTRGPAAIRASLRRCKPRLKVYGWRDLKLLCEATKLRNPRRLLESFPPADDLEGPDEAPQ